MVNKADKKARGRHDSGLVTGTRLVSEQYNKLGSFHLINININLQVLLYMTFSRFDQDIFYVYALKLTIGLIAHAQDNLGCSVVTGDHIRRHQEAGGCRPSQAKVQNLQCTI